MRLFSIFPNEVSFYEKMGVELFELDLEYENFFKQNAKIAGIDFYNTLFYQNKPFEWDDVSKRIAVLITSVALYQNWQILFSHKPAKLIGYGIGYLSALVCEGVISLRCAIKVIRSQDPNQAKILKLPGNVESLTERGGADNKGQLLDRMKHCLAMTGTPDVNMVMAGLEDAKIVMEVGPDNILSSMIDGKISSYYDTRRDCNHLLENVKYLKCFNQDYLILRFLGMMVSARNYNEDREASDKISKVYGKCMAIADKIRTGGFGKTPMAVLPGMPHTRPQEQPKSRISSQDDYFAALAYMRTIFELKALPKHEVSQRIKTLESETMIPLEKDYENVIVTIV